MPRIPAQEGGGFQRIDPAGRIVVPTPLRALFRTDAPLYLLLYSDNGRFPRIYLLTEEGHARLLGNLDRNRYLASDAELRSYLDRLYLFTEMTAEVRTMDELGRITLGKPTQEKAQIREWYRISGNKHRPILTVWAKEVYLEVKGTLDPGVAPISGISSAGVLTGLGDLPLSLVASKEGEGGNGA